MSTTTTEPMPSVKDISWGLKSPENRAQDMREVFKNLDPMRKHLPLPKGIYNYGDMPLQLPGIILEPEPGVKKDEVVFKCAARWSNQDLMDQGKMPHNSASAFILSNGTDIRGFTLESTVEKNRQSSLFGYGYETDPPTPRKSYIHNMNLIGGAWCGYFWHNYMDYCSISASDLHAGNVALMLGKSIKDGQTIDLTDSRLRVNPNLTTQGGSTTNPMDGGSIGICVRGGNLNCRKVSMSITGQDVGRGPNLCGIQDHLDREGESTQYLKMFVYDVGIFLNPFPGRTLADYYVKDIDNQYGSLYQGGKSNAPDQKLRVAIMDRKPVWPE